MPASTNPAFNSPLLRLGELVLEISQETILTQMLCNLQPERAHFPLDQRKISSQVVVDPGPAMRCNPRSSGGSRGGG
ncbi:uncharacterized protein A4U43_C09F720 [Asparagus officinalis]|uniref:Uncharacterized protein n=1 Tax=Asparagus officinalis TaxID=4686 RepID=A0A5P1E4K5_ASPOF|nr:uncharacterized protein A4U43_C09F720 [Asparagus officinalis]